MGTTHHEVLSGHLRQYATERRYVEAFQYDFDISFASRRRAYGSEFSVYILKPGYAIKHIFGLELEVALFLFDYDSLEARTLQAVNQALHESPLDGRVEPAAYFLLTGDTNAGHWVSRYLNRNPQPRTPVTITLAELSGVVNEFGLRDLIAAHLHRRDLFDYRLPIDSDTYFFGRDSIVALLKDQIRKGQNTGLFGLRKTGKTSLIFKVRRDCKETKAAHVVYFDCKLPLIRKKSAEVLLSYVADAIAKEASIAKKNYQKESGYESIEAVVKAVTKRRPLCLVFDEIEFISPLSLTDAHWKSDFIDFWQTIWSLQSGVADFSFIVGGVNAAVCETPNFSKIQNPLFGIVNVEYLQGLDSLSLQSMIIYFGKQMGLEFQVSAINLLEEHCGRHPLLTRLACSYIHQKLERANQRRPTRITREYTASIMLECESEISSYCAHVVNELQDFYPDEYEVMKMASVGLKSDFLQYGKDREFTSHLRNYGVMTLSERDTPKITIPILRNYLRAEYCRASGSRIPREPVPEERQGEWISDMIARVVRDLRSLLQSLPAGDATPFGSRGIPDSDILMNIQPAVTREQFEVFISPFYKVFYENVTRHYSARGDFFRAFKSDWPSLFDAILRIKVYRDFNLHLDVSSETRSDYNRFVTLDLGGANPNVEVGGWLAVQQAILDELLYAVQIEAAARTR